MTLTNFHSVISEMFISIITCNPRFGKIYFTRIWIQILSHRGPELCNVYAKLNTYLCVFFWERTYLRI